MIQESEVINLVKGIHILPLCQNNGVTLQLKCEISDEGDTTETYVVIAPKEQWGYYTLSMAVREYCQQVAKQ